MLMKPLDDGLTVSDQITQADIPALQAAGVRHLICNRPDGEAEGQPAFAETAAAAEAAGITAHYLPISGLPGDTEAAAFGALTQTLDGKVHAFCRSGMRSTALWALSRSGDMPLAAILGAAQAAGYDLTKLAPRIAARAVPGAIAAE